VFQQEERMNTRVCAVFFSAITLTHLELLPLPIIPFDIVLYAFTLL